jgi:hypothetical protein
MPILYILTIINFFIISNNITHAYGNRHELIFKILLINFNINSFFLINLLRMNALNTSFENILYTLSISLLLTILILYNKDVLLYV